MKLLKTLRNKGLTFFGDIKVFPYPMFLLYDPGSYLIKGAEMREVMKLVNPGDILIRGFRSYLDGYFIPGFFSHAGVFIGEVSLDKAQKYNPDIRPESVQPGEQMVVHAMAKGVFMEDFLNFCRCDYLVVLRRNPSIESGGGDNLTNDEVFSSAINFIDRPYDFGFNFSDIEALSCTELVYACYKKVLEEYGVTIKSRQVLFLKKQMIIPDDFVTSVFDLVWKSPSVRYSKLAEIQKKNETSMTRFVTSCPDHSGKDHV
ncbi:MAG: YiiX/YebB-like N1pC/P60 family cysteine hydrolase [Marinilabilia sp.]